MNEREELIEIIRGTKAYEDIKGNMSAYDGNTKGLADVRVKDLADAILSKYIRKEDASRR